MHACAHFLYLSFYLSISLYIYIYIYISHKHTLNITLPSTHARNPCDAAQMAAPAGQQDLAKAAKLVSDMMAVDRDFDLSGIAAVVVFKLWLFNWIDRLALKRSGSMLADAENQVCLVS